MTPGNCTNGKGRSIFKNISTSVETAQEAGEFRLPFLTFCCAHNSLASFNFSFTFVRLPDPVWLFGGSSQRHSPKCWRNREVYNMAMPPWSSQDNKDERERLWVMDAKWLLQTGNGTRLRGRRGCVSEVTAGGKLLEDMGPQLCLRGRTYITNVLQSFVVGFLRGFFCK